MSGRSWRPDSSLGDTVADDTVAGHLDDQEVRDGVRQFLSHSEVSFVSLNIIKNPSHIVS